MKSKKVNKNFEKPVAIKRKPPVPPVIKIKPVKIVEEKIPDKPVVVKEDFFIEVVSGYLGKTSGSTVYRVDVHSSISGQVSKINGEEVQPGFGVGAREAIEDFIRRNSSKLINEVFDAG